MRQTENIESNPLSRDKVISVTRLRDDWNIKITTIRQEH